MSPPSPSCPRGWPAHPFSDTIIAANTINHGIYLIILFSLAHFPVDPVFQNSLCCESTLCRLSKYYKPNFWHIYSTFYVIFPATCCDEQVGDCPSSICPNKERLRKNVGGSGRLSTGIGRTGINRFIFELIIHPAIVYISENGTKWAPDNPLHKKDIVQSIKQQPISIHYRTNIFFTHHHGLSQAFLH